MSSDSHATITYTSMSSYEVIVNGYYGMPMDPLDPYVQLAIEAPPSPEYIPGPEAPPSPDYIPGPEAPPLPDYIPGPEYPEYLPPADDSEPEMEPEEEDGDDEKSEEDSIEYLTSGGDDDADDNGDDLSEDDANDGDEEEESSDSEEEEEEHLALTVPASALHSPIPAFEDSDETESFKEGETAATPPSFRYRVAAKISIRPALTIADRRRADDGLIGRLRRERRYFCTLSTIYAQEVAHSLDYCTQIMDYCQSREAIDVIFILSLSCSYPFVNKQIMVEKYIGRVPNTIHDSVKATKLKIMREAIEFATELMDKRIRDAVENKQKFEEEESLDSEEEEEEHLALTVPALALYSSVFASEETEPF
nr:hypothetical protein [Tanacetum cinerariifolium]